MSLKGKLKGLNVLKKAASKRMEKRAQRKKEYFQDFQELQRDIQVCEIEFNRLQHAFRQQKTPEELTHLGHAMTFHNTGIHLASMRISILQIAIMYPEFRGKLNLNSKKEVRQALKLAKKDYADHRKAMNTVVKAHNLTQNKAN